MHRGVRAALLLASALLASACIATPRGQLTPTPLAATATSTPPPVTNVTLPAAQAEALLRRTVCWLADPALAPACLPPQQDALLAIEEMGRSGDRRFTAPLVDLIALELGWRVPVDAALTRLTGASVSSPRAWREWLAHHPTPPPPGYAAWKARLLALTAASTQQPKYDVLLTERLGAALPLIHWIGVQPNASRPLVTPRPVSGRASQFLAATDVVYGIVANEQARAYPQRIVAWHGLVNDTLGGVPVVLSHCLPCGGAVAFDRRVGGRALDFGTAGLALHSRTLLFDAQESRLWDALTGESIGEPRTSLTWLPAFTTTWQDWLARHPDTTVVDTATGVVRDYAAGAATVDVAASAAPLYPVAPLDGRYQPREPVFGVAAGGAFRAYLVSEAESRRVIHDRLGTQDIVVLSEGRGLAIGAYKADGVQFQRLEGTGVDLVAIDEHGERWDMREQALVHHATRKTLAAVPWRQAYWFAWSGAYLTPASTPPVDAAPRPPQ